MNKLGRLERVPLRDIWKSESSDFTPWLAQPEHIALLGEAIGLDLEVEAQEKDVGPFRADILCKETGSDAWVLIENQLERTDHGHLGQLLTYAAGLEAVIVVWIAERFTEEHRAALDWLNEIANEKLRCFGLEVELWRIGESPVAPKFNVVSQPNDWARSVSTTAGSIASGELTATKQLQLEYWTAFSRCMQENKSKLRPQKPSPQHWLNLALGRSGIHLVAIADTSKDEVRADVYVNHPRFSKTWFAELKADAEAIEKEIGEEVYWHDPPNARACRITLKTPADLHDRARWPTQHAWLKEHLETLARVFGPRARALSSDGGGAEET
jgi:Domain of unknown function (DUF4268)